MLSVLPRDKNPTLSLGINGEIHVGELLEMSLQQGGRYIRCELTLDSNFSSIARKPAALPLTSELSESFWRFTIVTAPLLIRTRSTQGNAATFSDLRITHSALRR